MSITKYVQRLRHMDYLIKAKMTGNPQQFAEKLNISRSTLWENLQEIKLLGCKIDYCRDRETYIYEDRDHDLSKNFYKEKQLFPVSPVELDCFDITWLYSLYGPGLHIGPGLMNIHLLTNHPSKF